jgi:hypothetical protein
MEEMMGSFYLRDVDLTKEELLKLVEVIASCTDMDEVYYNTEEEDRPLLIKSFKSRFLP